MHSNGKLEARNLNHCRRLNELSQVPINSNHQIRTYALRQTSISLPRLRTTVCREREPTTDCSGNSLID